MQKSQTSKGKEDMGLDMKRQLPDRQLMLTRVSMSQVSSYDFLVQLLMFDKKTEKTFFSDVQFWF